MAQFECTIMFPHDISIYRAGYNGHILLMGGMTLKAHCIHTSGGKRTHILTNATCPLQLNPASEIIEVELF